MFPILRHVLGSSRVVRELYENWWCMPLQSEEGGLFITDEVFKDSETGKP